VLTEDGCHRGHAARQWSRRESHSDFIGANDEGDLSHDPAPAPGIEPSSVVLEATLRPALAGIAPRRGIEPTLTRETTELRRQSHHEASTGVECRSRTELPALSQSALVAERVTPPRVREAGLEPALRAPEARVLAARHYSLVHRRRIERRSRGLQPRAITRLAPGACTVRESNAPLGLERPGTSPKVERCSSSAPSGCRTRFSGLRGRRLSWWSNGA